MMTLSEAQEAGYRPCDRVRDWSVKVVNPAGHLATAHLTTGEWCAQYRAVSRARSWISDTFGDGSGRVEGDALRPTLGGHVRAAGHVWIHAHWKGQR